MVPLEQWMDRRRFPRSMWKHIDAHSDANSDPNAATTTIAVRFVASRDEF